MQCSDRKCRNNNLRNLDICPRCKSRTYLKYHKHDRETFVYLASTKDIEKDYLGVDVLTANRFAKRITVSTFKKVVRKHYVKAVLGLTVRKGTHEFITKDGESVELLSSRFQGHPVYIVKLGNVFNYFIKEGTRLRKRFTNLPESDIPQEVEMNPLAKIGGVPRMKGDF